VRSGYILGDDVPMERDVDLTPRSIFHGTPTPHERFSLGTTWYRRRGTAVAYGGVRSRSISWWLSLQVGRVRPSGSFRRLLV
jgi:hypothetical protein